MIITALTWQGKINEAENVLFSASLVLNDAS